MRTQIIQSQIKQSISEQPYGSGELSRLMTAAVINQKFRSLLLYDPVMALSSGFQGEKFSLAADEVDSILSIHASNLADFAEQLLLARDHHGREKVDGAIVPDSSWITALYAPVVSAGND